MKYVNNTLHGVKVPVKNGSYPPHWITFKVGEEKELEDRASDAAELLGLTKCAVCEKEVKKVEAETKTVHKKNKVETKKKKRS